MMDLNIINTKLNIYESYEAGLITESEKFELLYIVEHEAITDDELMLEKKTRDEYARDKFKKKYNFKPEDKYGERGTITVKGKEIPVVLSKSKFMNHKGDKASVSDIANGDAIPRQTKVNVDDNSITLDKNVFKLKNQKRRDAIMHHELAHRNFQFPESSKDKQVPEVRKQQINQTTNILKSAGLSDDDIKNSKKDIQDAVNTKLLHGKKYDTKNKERSDALKKVDSKYKSNSNWHVNGLEKEADIIAAKNTSRKDFTKGLNEYYSHVRDNEKKSVKKVESNLSKQDKPRAKEYLHQFNKNADEDFKKRAQSLKDNDLYNINYYNKNH